MKTDQVARRYATALFHEVGDDAVKGDKWCEELKAVAVVFAVESVSVQLKNPTVTQDVKQSILQSGLDAAGASKEVQGLCLAMLFSGRLMWIPSVAKEFEKFVQELKGETHGVITTAVELSTHQVAEIAKKMGEKMGTKAILRTHVDKEVLAGFKVQLGMRMADMTLQKKLQTLMG